MTLAEQLKAKINAQPMALRAITVLDAADIAQALINHGIPFTCCGTFFEIAGGHAKVAMHIIHNTLAPTRWVCTL
jgi:hypothetical protein